MTNTVIMNIDKNDPADDVAVVIQQEPEAEEDKERVYLCKACGCEITTDSFRLVKQGAFVHTFTNPAGFVYRVACFKSAPGCNMYGEYTKDFSWFKKYAWCYAVCKDCYNHLGWHFSRESGTDFFALILAQLVH